MVHTDRYLAVIFFLPGFGCLVLFAPTSYQMVIVSRFLLTLFQNQAVMLTAVHFIADSEIDVKLSLDVFIDLAATQLILRQ